MSSYIIASAGHVDHGKTTLVKALTGKDLDTHKEEKRRGITINTGYTSLVLDDVGEVSLVDVPGHHDFVKNMIAAATGIDLVMMVIAADSGPEAQSVEHLQILETLGVTKGVIVVSRSDLIDDESREILMELVEEFREATFLEGCPVLPLNSLSGEGVPALKSELSRQLQQLNPRQSNGPFRLYIDRSFIIQGHGTVVTGSVHSGMFDQQSQQAKLLPVAEDLKIRSMQRHGHATQVAQAGDRCSLNLSGLEREQAQRGMIVSDRLLKNTQLIDCSFYLFADALLKNYWFDAIFYSGSLEAQVRVSILDTRVLKQGETCLLQIHFDQALPFCPGDRFVLRDSSNERTLGGGRILDPFPLHHRRRREWVIDSLNAISNGGLGALLHNKIMQAVEIFSSRQLAEHINCSVAEVEQAANSDLNGIERYQEDGVQYFIDRKRLQKLHKNILFDIKEYHQLHFLQQEGISINECHSRLESRGWKFEQQFLLAVLKKLRSKQKLKTIANSWALASHEILNDADIEKKISFVKEFFERQAAKLHTPSVLLETAAKEGIDDQLLKKIINYLIKSGYLIRCEDILILTRLVDSAREQMLEALKGAQSKGMTVANLRDLIDGNRRMALSCFSLFEKEGLVVRKGDYRVLARLC